MTSRRLQSLIPSITGALMRELPEPKYAPGGYANSGSPLAANAKIGSMYEYKFYDASGVIQRKFFVSALVPGTPNAYFLFLQVGDGPTGYWNPEAAGKAVWTDYLVFQTINNLLHVSDGVTNMIYDGPNGVWIEDGLPISTAPPAISVTVGTGSDLIPNNRYYWTTFADQTVGRVHEGSSSPISAGSGNVKQTGGKVTVYQRAGTIAYTNGSKVITGTGTDFSAADVGRSLYIAGSFFGTIASYQSATQVTMQLVAQSTASGVHFVLAPARATHWHIYASEADTSKVGYYLTAVPVTTMSYDDSSPFLGVAGSLFSQVSRPVRNDPAPVSRLLVSHKYRLWRRRETKPNFFNFTANEEVSAFVNGAPQECVPGADTNTISDIVNEDPYPIEPSTLRAFASHGDALWMGTENNILPLYGESVDDFAVSQVTALSIGVAGRSAMISTPHGLAFMSYDRKLFLYPQSVYPWMNGPKDVNVTEQLQEIGRSMRVKFEAILATDLDNVHLVHYFFGRRDWLVLCFQDNTNVYHTWIYDFETKGWFELQRGFVSVAVFELSEGVKVLVGGGSDGWVYVIDDLTNTFSITGSYPAATWRPALIDFGDPDVNHVPQFLEFEITNEDLADDITVNYYLDPDDVDNLDASQQQSLEMTKLRIGSNRYRGFFGDGVLCQRLLLEFAVGSSTNAGGFRGVKLVAQRSEGLAD